MESIVELEAMPYYMVIPKNVEKKGMDCMKEWAESNMLKSVDGRDYEVKILDIKEAKSNNGNKWYEAKYLHEGFKPGEFENLCGVNGEPLPQRTIDDLYNKYSTVE